MLRCSLAASTTSPQATGSLTRPLPGGPRWHEFGTQSGNSASVLARVHWLRCVRPCLSCPKHPISDRGAPVQSSVSSCLSPSPTALVRLGKASLGSHKPQKTTLTGVHHQTWPRFQGRDSTGNNTVETRPINNFFLDSCFRWKAPTAEKPLKQPIWAPKMLLRLGRSWSPLSPWTSSQ